MAWTIADSLSKGAYHVSNNTVEYNPQRKNNFTLIITDVDNLPRMDATANNDGTFTDTDEQISDGQEQIILSLRTCNTPAITQNTISINRGNSTIKFPGKPSFGELSIEVYDYIGSNAKDILLAWQALSYNAKYDYVGNASSYKKDIELYQLTPDGQLVRYWEIKGAWVSTVGAGDFTVDDGDSAQTVTATIQYDWAMLHLPDDAE